jgi:two-component system sensor histidine kinase DegS
MKASHRPASTRGVDVRVAESPFVALRFFVDARIADLDESTDELERALVDAGARRATLRAQLRRNEEARHRGLADLAGRPPHILVRALHDGLAITEEIGEADAHVAALQRRLDAIAAERALQRTVSTTLARSDPNQHQHAAASRRLNQAARAIHQVVDTEHNALAQQILEGPMQRLTDAAFEAELAERHLERDRGAAAEHIHRCRRETLGAAAELERLTARLQPMGRADSLVAALRALLAQQEDGRDARLRLIGPPRRLPHLTELAIYRIVEEAVGNATRHSRSPRIEVVLAYHPDRVAMVVRDEGEGFDVAATEARLGRTGGLGLIEMRARAELVGSRLEVRSLLGVGTEVRATLPQSG